MSADLHAAKHALRDRWRPAGWRLDLHRALPDGRSIDLVISSLESSTLVDIVRHPGPDFDVDARLKDLKEKATLLRRHHMRADRGKAPPCARALVVCGPFPASEEVWPMPSGANPTQILSDALDRLDLRPPPRFDGHSTTPGLAMARFGETLDALGHRDALLLTDGRWHIGRIAGGLDRTTHRCLDFKTTLNPLRRLARPTRIPANTVRRDGQLTRDKLPARGEVQMTLLSGERVSVGMVGVLWAELGFVAAV